MCWSFIRVDGIIRFFALLDCRTERHGRSGYQISSCRISREVLSALSFPGSSIARHSSIQGNARAKYRGKFPFTAHCSERSSIARLLIRSDRSVLISGVCGLGGIIRFLIFSSANIIICPWLGHPVSYFRPATILFPARSRIIRKVISSGDGSCNCTVIL